MPKVLYPFRLVYPRIVPIVAIQLYCCSIFGCHILVNNRQRPILCMAAIRQIGPIRLVPIYLQRVAIRSIGTKFHQGSFKTEILVCISTERHIDTGTRTDGLVKILIEFDLLIRTERRIGLYRFGCTRRCVRVRPLSCSEKWMISLFQI